MEVFKPRAVGITTGWDPGDTTIAEDLREMRDRLLAESSRPRLPESVPARLLCRIFYWEQTKLLTDIETKGTTTP